MKISPFNYQSLTDEEPASSPVVLDAVEGEIEIVEDTVVVTFDEDEMEVAKKSSYDDGFMAGKKEGLREAELQAQQHQAEITTVLGKVETGLQVLQQQYTTAITQRQSELGKLVLTCAEKIAGEALRKNPTDDIHEMITECLSGLFDTPEVTAIVNPHLVEELQNKLPSNVTLQADETVQINDCRITWQHGEAMRDSSNLWNEVEQVIQRHFAKAPTPSQASKNAALEKAMLQTPIETQGENNE